jgi:hypothetical protein
MVRGRIKNVIKTLDNEMENKQGGNRPDDSTGGQRSAGDVNASAVEKIIEDLERQAAHARRVGLATTAFGAVIIGLAHWYYGAQEFWGEFFRDIGISLVVAGIVGIYYDWFINSTGRARALALMRGDIQSLLKTGENVEMLMEKVSGGNDPVMGIKRTLEFELLPNYKYSKVIDGVERLLREIFAIRDLHNKKAAKEIAEYIRYIAWILEEYTVCGAIASRKLIEGMYGEGETGFDYSPLELRVLTLKLLSCQMDSMRERDEYHSLANTWLYAKMSNSYIEATHRALKEKVKIRRIFNLCREETSSRIGDFEAAVKLATDHIFEFGEPEFECRFMTCQVVDALELGILENAGVSSRDSVKVMYFGHFYHTDDNKMFRFESKSSGDIGALNITTYSTNVNNPNFLMRRLLFDHLWSKSLRELPATPGSSQPASSIAAEKST